MAAAGTGQRAVRRRPSPVADGPTARRLQPTARVHADGAAGQAAAPIEGVLGQSQRGPAAAVDSECLAGRGPMRREAPAEG
jgi:hypothetical protein